MQPLLRDRDFRMDDQRNYLVFDDCAYDRDRDTFVPAVASHPQLPLHWLGLEWLGANSGAGGQGTGMPDGPEAAGALEHVSTFIPALGFLFSICGSWDRLLYLCKHLARATFALPYLARPVAQPENM